MKIVFENVVGQRLEYASMKFVIQIISVCLQFEEQEHYNGVCVVVSMLD